MSYTDLKVMDNCNKGVTMANQTRILVVLLLAMSGINYASEPSKQFYYIKNDTGLDINIQINCGVFKEVLGLKRNKTSRFFLTKCTEAKPTLSIVEIGTKDSLAKVKDISLSKSYVRIYRDAKSKKITFDPPQDLHPDDETIENYDLSL